MEEQWHHQYFFSPGGASIESNPDEYAANPRFQELQSELRSLLFATAQSNTPTRQLTPELLSETQKSGTSPGHQRLLVHLQATSCQIPLPQIVTYLNSWMQECAPWLDMFDQWRTFGIQVPLLAQSSPTVLFALLALGARQVERAGTAMGASQDSLELYSLAIESLTPALERKDETVLVTACILCVLEMFSASPRDWRRHIEGCAALFEASGVNGFSGGLLQAVFWCYARMDLCGAMMSGCTEGTVMPIERWVLSRDDSSLDEMLVDKMFIKAGTEDPDMHANYAVYLAARTCGLLSKRTRCVELGEETGCHDDAYDLQWQSLWCQLQEWEQRRPPAVRPVKVVPEVPDFMFPKLFYGHWAAISSNQLYYSSCLMMLDLVPQGCSLEGDKNIHSRLWHARQIVGISLANAHRGCLNNAIQPLWLAGQLFTHRQEHETVIQLLNCIEAASGWASRWRIKDLEDLWGYPRGTFSHGPAISTSMISNRDH